MDYMNDIISNEISFDLFCSIILFYNLIFATLSYAVYFNQRDSFNRC